MVDSRESAEGKSGTREKKTPVSLGAGEGKDN